MIRVGFGVTALAKAQAGGAHDGISHYTQELWHQLNQQAGIRCTPFSFGVAAQDKYLNEADASQAPSQTLSAYAKAAAWSVLSGQDYLGIDRISSKVDLIHATDHYIPKCHSRPVIASLMDAIPFSHPEWSGGSFRSVKNALWLKAIGWANKVITISEYSKDELSKWANIEPNKIVVIPLGVDQRWFADVAATSLARVRQTYQLPEQFFISVGTLQPRKNIGSTIQAHRGLCASLREQYPLVIVGRAGWRCEDVLAMIQQDSATGTVFWLPQVSDQDLLAIVKMARGLVFPSLAEGFGLPVLEAFAAQVPVITSNTTSLPEVAGNAALCVTPTDVDAIAQAMLRLIDDQDLCLSLRARGLERAKAFSWEACAQGTASVYRQMLSA
jgi:glycosyltransferase involved in cell wall biosynthesis